MPSNPAIAGPDFAADNSFRYYHRLDGKTPRPLIYLNMGLLLFSNAGVKVLKVYYTDVERGLGSILLLSKQNYYFCPIPKPKMYIL